MTTIKEEEWLEVKTLAGDIPAIKESVNNVLKSQIENLAESLQERTGHLAEQADNLVKHVEIRTTQIDNLEKNLQARTEHLARQTEHLVKQVENRTTQIENLEKFLQSQTERLDRQVENRTAQIEDLKILLQAQTEHLDRQSQATQRCQQSVENIDKNFQNVLTKIEKVEYLVNNSQEYNGRLHQLFDERLGGIQQDIKSTREIDIRGISERINLLPTLKELADSNSPLATKGQMTELISKVSNLDGKLSSNFWTVIVVVGTTTAVNLWSLFVGFPSIMKNYAPQQTTTVQPTMPSTNTP